MTLLLTLQTVSKLLMLAVLGIVTFKVSTLLGVVLSLAYVVNIASAYQVEKQLFKQEQESIRQLMEKYAEQVNGGHA